jgi:Flp pilus assembly protein CpaB
MTYRLRNIAIAIALAVLAAMLTSFYVNQYKQDLKEGQDPTAVWVATEDIPAGTTGGEAADLLEKRQIAKEHVVPGAIVNPTDIADQVATEKIYAGEQVTELRFGTQAQTGVRGQLSGNLRAMQVPGDANQLLAGTLRAGDRVDIVATIKYKFVNFGPAPPGTSNEELTASRIVLRDILVLRPAAGGGVLEDESKLTDSTSGGLSVILAITDAQAQKLAFLTQSDGSKWTLDLRATADPKDSPESVETVGTVLTDGLSPADIRELAPQARRSR